MTIESYEDFSCVFTAVFDKNGLGKYISEEYIRKFYELTKILLETNEKTNLTAIEDTKNVIVKHYADSLMAADEFANNCSVIDVGCGAGFPSIPLAIVRPDLKITALDSTGKKIDFVKAACNKLGLGNINAVCDRAEAYIKASNKREQFDYGTARAVSRLNVLDELILPFVKIGGKFIAMKGKDGQTELSEAQNGIRMLGGKVVTVNASVLYDDTEETGDRTTIIVEKVAETPQKYPRAYAKITKNPL